MHSQVVCGAVNFQIRVLQFDQPTATLLKNCVQNYTDQTLWHKIVNAVKYCFGRSEWQLALNALKKWELALTNQQLVPNFPPIHLSLNPEALLTSWVKLNKDRVELPQEFVTQYANFDFARAMIVFRQIITRPLLVNTIIPLATMQPINYTMIRNFLRNDTVQAMLPQPVTAALNAFI